MTAKQLEIFISFHRAEMLKEQRTRRGIVKARDFGNILSIKEVYSSYELMKAQIVSPIIILIIVRYWGTKTNNN